MCFCSKIWMTSRGWSIFLPAQFLPFGDPPNGPSSIDIWPKTCPKLIQNGPGPFCNNFGYVLGQTSKLDGACWMAFWGRKKAKIRLEAILTNLAYKSFKSKPLQTVPTPTLPTRTRPCRSKILNVPKSMLDPSQNTCMRDVMLHAFNAKRMCF